MNTLVFPCKRQTWFKNGSFCCSIISRLRKACLLKLSSHWSALQKKTFLRTSYFFIFILIIALNWYFCVFWVLLCIPSDSLGTSALNSCYSVFLTTVQVRHILPDDPEHRWPVYVCVYNWNSFKTQCLGFVCYTPTFSKCHLHTATLNLLPSNGSWCNLKTIAVDQRLANYILQVKSSLPLIFVNKVLLAHNYISWWSVYGCFHAVTAEFSSCDREHMAHKT